MTVYNGVHIIRVVIVYTTEIGSNIQKSDLKKKKKTYYSRNDLWYENNILLLYRNSSSPASVLVLDL